MHILIFKLMKKERERERETHSVRMPSAGSEVKGRGLVTVQRVDVDCLLLQQQLQTGHNTPARLALS